MMREAKYLGFGLLVLAGYWLTVSRGIVYWSTDQAPQGAPVRTGTGGLGRSHSTYWGGGFQGGK